MAICQSEGMLIVEDEHLIREFLVDYLSDLGYRTSAYRNGKEALDSFQPGAFDLLLTDLLMPGLNGLDLIAELRDRDPDLYSIIVTGNAGMLDGEEIPENVEVIQKPVSLARLNTAVRRGVTQTREYRRARLLIAKTAPPKSLESRTRDTVVGF